MTATPTTDERLRSYLNGNQLARERLCSALLAIDRRFSGIKPRHPAGGPDGGIDLEATYQGAVAANIAVGFLNSVADTRGEATKIKNKFKKDLEASAACEPRPGLFVFFTNVHLTVGTRDALTGLCRDAGILQCEIFDRERCRVMLDSPDGFAIRMQVLGLPMTETEQITFFSRWGDGIQSVIATGFTGVEQAMLRAQFLSEAEQPLELCTVMFELDRPYLVEELGHFRVHAQMRLWEPVNGLITLLSGAADNHRRIHASVPADLDHTKHGAKQGIGGRTWAYGVKRAWELGESLTPKELSAAAIHGEGAETWELKNFATIKNDRCLQALTLDFGFAGMLGRLPPYLQLKDLDRVCLTLSASRSLAEKLKAIHVLGNEYKLAEFSAHQIRLFNDGKQPYFPMPFTPEELTDEWVLLLPKRGGFGISFSETTPRRMFDADLVQDSLYKLRKQRIEAETRRDQTSDT